MEKDQDSLSPENMVGERTMRKPCSWLFHAVEAHFFFDVMEERGIP